MKKKTKKKVNTNLSTKGLFTPMDKAADTKKTDNPLFK